MVTNTKRAVWAKYFFLSFQIGRENYAADKNPTECIFVIAYENKSKNANFGKISNVVWSENIKLWSKTHP